jgi:hypothetical protein
MLLAILPTPAEVQSVKRHRGAPQDLAQAELFFLRAASIPRLRERARCLAFQARFAQAAEDLGSNLAIVAEACAQLSSSRSLRLLLKVALHLGNQVNSLGGSERRTKAITVESLLQLSRVKSFKGSVSLLDVLENVVAAQAPHAIEASATELSALEPAGRKQLSALQSEQRRLARGLDRYRAELEEVKENHENSRGGACAPAAAATAFCEEAGATLSRLSEIVAETERLSAEMVEYLSEDRAYAARPESLFQKLNTFLKSVKRTHLVNAGKRERKKRAQERAEAQAAKAARKWRGKAKGGGARAPKGSGHRRGAKDGKLAKYLENTMPDL